MVQYIQFTQHTYYIPSTHSTVLAIFYSIFACIVFPPAEMLCFNKQTHNKI